MTREAEHIMDQREKVCLDCPLPDCNEHSEHCPRRQAKHDKRVWEREADKVREETWPEK